MYPDDPEKQAYGRKVMQRKARDNARTPVQWDNTTHAGFTSANSKPWMRVNDDYKRVNVAVQTSGANSSTSVHAFWKRSLDYRKQNKDLYVYGDFELVNPEKDPNSAEIMAYRRWNRDRDVLVVLNFSGKEVQWDLVDGMKIDRWVAGNYGEASLKEKPKSVSVLLKPWEGLIGELT
jgi:oligo-1,6-glucosidase